MLEYSKIVQDVREILSSAPKAVLIEDDGHYYLDSDHTCEVSEFIKAASANLIGSSLQMIAHIYLVNKESINSILDGTFKYDTKWFFSNETGLEDYLAAVAGLLDDDYTKLYQLHDDIMSISVDTAQLLVVQGYYAGDPYYSKLFESGLDTDYNNFDLDYNDFQCADLIQIDGVNYRWLEGGDSEAAKQNENIGIQILKLAKLLTEEFSDNLKFDYLWKPYALHNTGIKAAKNYGFELSRSDLLVRASADGNKEEYVALMDTEPFYDGYRLMFDTDYTINETDMKRAWALFKQYHTLLHLNNIFKNHSFLVDWVKGNLKTADIVCNMQKENCLDIYMDISIEFSMYKMAVGILEGNEKFINHPDWEGHFYIGEDGVNTTDAEHSGYLDYDYPELVFEDDELEKSLDSCHKMISDAYTVVNSNTRWFMSE